MPIYDYKCVACKHIIELTRRTQNRNDFTRCPRCDNEMHLKITCKGASVWKPIELELETDKPRVYESKRALKNECKRLGKMMPGWDIYGE